MVRNEANVAEISLVSFRFQAYCHRTKYLISPFSSKKILSFSYLQNLPSSKETRIKRNERANTLNKIKKLNFKVDKIKYIKQ